MSEPDLHALAAFLPALENPGFKAGEIISPPKDENGVMQMPYARHSETSEEFVRAAYDHGWVLRDFDWGKWAGSAEAARLRDDENILAQATPEQLMQLLTVCIRQDRFSEGALLDAFESGLILRIVRRAAAITDSQSGREKRA